jgi:uncharacterized protein YjbJ (UPF0337 family)
MNRQQLQGQLLQVTGALRQGWGRVINDQTMQIRGERQRLLGRLQAHGGAVRLTIASRRKDQKPTVQR